MKDRLVLGLIAATISLAAAFWIFAGVVAALPCNDADFLCFHSTTLAVAWVVVGSALGGVALATWFYLWDRISSERAKTAGTYRAARRRRAAARRKDQR